MMDPQIERKLIEIMRVIHESDKPIGARAIADHHRQRRAAIATEPAFAHVRRPPARRIAALENIVLARDGGEYDRRRAARELAHAAMAIGRVRRLAEQAIADGAAQAAARPPGRAALHQPFAPS